MKPNLQIFAEYIKKYPSKRVCLRVLYKDYKVDKDNRESWRKAYDYIKGKLDARAATQAIESESEEVEVEGET